MRTDVRYRGNFAEMIIYVFCYIDYCLIFLIVRYRSVILDDNGEDMVYKGCS